MPRIGRVLEAEQSGELGHGLVRAKSLLHRYKSAAPPSVPRYYVEFDGDSSYINCGSDASLDDIPWVAGAPNPFTVDGWVRMNRADVELPGNIIVSKLGPDGEGALGWFLSANWDGIATKFYANIACYNDGSAIENVGFAVNTWVHLLGCLAADGACYLALDGEWCTYSSSVPLTIYPSDAGEILLMGKQYDDSSYLSGDIQWLRISSGIRYPIGVNFTPPAMCAPPAVDGTTIELWALDEGVGAVTAAEVNTPTNDGAMTDCVWHDCV